MSAAYLKHVRKIVLILLVLLLFLAAPAFTYDDIPSGHWAEREISLLTGHEIIGGYSDGTFRGDHHITRAEFSKMVVEALRLESEAYNLYRASSSFRDVASNHWARGHIEIAYEKGIIQGDGRGYFNPGANIRRDEAAAILVRAMRYSLDTHVELEFADKDDIPSWALESVQVAVEKGLIRGFPDNTFRPGGNTTRAEAASLIERILERRGDLYQLWGKVDKVDPKAETIRLEIDGESYTFNLSADVIIYFNGEKKVLGELEAEKAEEAVFILNRQEEINFIEFTNDLDEFVNSHTMEEYLVPEKGDEGAVLFNAEENQEHLDSALMGAVVSTDGVSESMNLNRQEMKVDQFTEVTGSDGSGKKIAIIDTGVDPGHPDLAATTWGENKIVDWIDFTDEGEIRLDGVLEAGKDRYTINGRSYRLGNIPSATGEYRYGFLKESEISRDINHSGNMEDEFLVVATSSDGMNYDTVYVDTAGDRDLRNEQPLRVYREDPYYFSFGDNQDEYTYNFVVAGIDPGGSWVRLGSDFHGHGTHVAGIAAANGGIKGVAPGARLMVVKALDSHGETGWNTLRDAMRYAAENGADVINLSLAYYEDKTAGNNAITYLISQLSREYDVVFTVSTGNRGPGIASTATPGNARDAISVGGYVFPEAWELLHGWEVENNSLWIYSSTGPREDGLIIPSVVAPASAVSTVPMWSGDGYQYGEGTSMAAPHAAGAVALLLDGMSRMDRDVNQEDVRRAITLGATSLEGFTPTEAGAGGVNVVEAWRKLLLVNESLPLRARTYNRQFVIGEGFYERDSLPGRMIFNIENKASREVVVDWDTTEKWLYPDIESTKIASGSTRNVGVHYSVPEEPGLYSALLRGDIKDTYSYDITVLSTIIKPYHLEEDNNYRLDFGNELAAGQHKRYFINVPEETGSLQVRLAIEEAGGDLKGRARFHIIKPDGSEYLMTDYAGAVSGGGIARNSVTGTVEGPESGTWEILVYSSPGLSSLGLSQSIYDLEIFGLDVVEKAVDMDSPWIVKAAVSDNFEAGETGYITFHVIEKGNKRPVTGVVEIMGRLYQIRDGRITLQGHQIEHI